MASQKSAMDRGKVLGMVLMGCDLEIAAHTVGWNEEKLKAECESHPDFAADLALREGSVELHHMRNVHKAAEDVKNWRASTWWLARQSAERRDRKLRQTLTIGEIQSFVQDVVDIVLETIVSEADRDRLIARLFAKASEQDRQAVASMIGEPLLREALEYAED